MRLPQSAPASEQLEWSLLHCAFAIEQVVLYLIMNVTWSECLL